MYYRVLIRISPGYPLVKGRLHTCYSPVRRSLWPKSYTARLACVRPIASVHPEPGSNSSLYICYFIELIPQKDSLYLHIQKIIIPSASSFTSCILSKLLSKKLSGTKNFILCTVFVLSSVCKSFNDRFLSPSVLKPLLALLSESGCKGKTFFITNQTLKQLFLKFF